jgi:hypothetical protein
MSNFIKRNVPRSFSSSASFLGRNLIISIFVSSHMDGLDLSSILNLPYVLDCLPPFVRKFWSPPLVAWKYVKTSSQEFFSYEALENKPQDKEIPDARGGEHLFGKEL